MTTGAGFSDPITGGNILVQPAIQSPNFSIANQTGWAIMINGSAYFFNITTSGSIIIGNSQGWFMYNGTPGAGNPPVAYGAAPGVTADPFGNTLPQTAGGMTSVLAGIEYAALTGGGLQIAGLATNASATPGYVELPGIGGSYQILQLSSGTQKAASVASILNLSDSGRGTPALQVVDGQDGNTYDTQTLRLDAIGTQTIATTANNVILGTSGTGLTCPVAARKYRVQGRVTWLQGTGAVAQVFGFTGPAVSSMDIACDMWEQPGTGQQIFSGNITAIGGHISTPAVGAGIINAFRFEGELTFSAAGTFAAVAAEGTAGDTFTVNPSGAIAIMDMMPV